jgi:outer membrane beta-barrel protein
MKKITDYIFLLLPVFLAGFTLAPASQAQTQTPVIEPQIDRREIRLPKFGASDFELGYFAGILSIEDFGAEPTSGGRLGYHVTEDFFVEGAYAESIISDQSFYNTGFSIFEERRLKLAYYHASIGYNLFPGEVFIGRNRALTSAVFVAAGIGNTKFNRENHTTFNYGFGIRLLPLNWLSLRLEFRDHMFESDLLGKNELKHNFELTFGLSGIF